MLKSSSIPRSQISLIIFLVSSSQNVLAPLLLLHQQLVPGPLQEPPDCSPSSQISFQIDFSTAIPPLKALSRLPTALGRKFKLLTFLNHHYLVPHCSLELTSFQFIECAELFLLRDACTLSSVLRTGFPSNSVWLASSPSSLLSLNFTSQARHSLTIQSKRGLLSFFFLMVALVLSFHSI